LANSHSEEISPHLQSPVRRQGLPGRGQRVLDDRVRVLEDRAAQLGAVAHPHDHGSSGQRAEVDADHQRVG
jgi:hypothetical protein